MPSPSRHECIGTTLSGPALSSVVKGKDEAGITERDLRPRPCAEPWEGDMVVVVKKILRRSILGRWRRKKHEMNTVSHAQLRLNSFPNVNFLLRRVSTTSSTALKSGIVRNFCVLRLSHYFYALQIMYEDEWSPVTGHCRGGGVLKQC